MSSAEELNSDIDNDLEVIQEGEADEVEIVQNPEENVEEANGNEENAEDETKKVVKPKRVIKNPQPKLNEQTLKGPKGLAAIEGYFERVKFKGRGYEEQDLNVLMKTYEYWCHRLFPKFPFDDCIARLEKLGTKKVTQTHIKRIRLDINFDDDKPLLSDEEENDTGGFVDTNNDQFDQLLSSTTTKSSEPVVEMTEEQLERMRENKERAQRLREERLRKIREKAQNNLGESSQIITQSSQDINIATDSHIRSSQDNIYETSNTSENGNEFQSNQTNLQDNHESTKTFDVSSTNVNDNCSQNDSGKGTKESDKFESRLQQDHEGDTLELGKKTATKKKRVIESDSEDEVSDEDDTVEKNPRHSLEGANDGEKIDELVTDNGDSSISNCNGVINTQNHSDGYTLSQNKQQIIDNQNEAEENDIENILNEINTDDNYPVGSTQNMDDRVNETSVLEENQPMDTIEENQPMDTIEETA